MDEDPEALAALYAADATFSCRAWDFTIDAVEIPDVVMGAGTDFVEFEPTTVLVGDEVIVAEYAVNGVSPSGQSVATPLLAVFELAPNGLLAGSTIDDDRAAMFPTAPDETRHSSGPMPERHPAQAAPASESSSDSASTPPAR